ncbi:MAG: cellulose binding domain-containing protein, partial [Cyanobacteria bacterium J06623_7]
MSESISVNYSEVQNWGNGFQGQISLTNNGDSNLVNWDLDFDLPAEIDNIWDAEIISNGNGSYSIQNAPWNREITAGETVTLGFTANGGGTAQNFNIEGSSFNSPSNSASIFT